MSAPCPPSLDRSSRAATLDGKPLDLTFTEFEILYCLAATPGRVYSPQELYTAAWGAEKYGDQTTVRVHIARLRQKLGACSSLVGTVRNVGYRFTGRGAVARVSPPVEMFTDCRSPEGVTVGLVDGLIAIARVLRSRPMETRVECAALMDLRADEDVRWLLGLAPVGVEAPAELGGGA